MNLIRILPNNEKIANLLVDEFSIISILSFQVYMFILYNVLAFNFDNKSIHCDLKTNKSLTDFIEKYIPLLQRSCDILFLINEFFSIRLCLTTSGQVRSSYVITPSFAAFGQDYLWELENSKCPMPSEISVIFYHCGTAYLKFLVNSLNESINKRPPIFDSFFFSSSAVSSLPTEQLCYVKSPFSAAPRHLGKRLACTLIIPLKPN
ncbi:hypothetical protein AGLY_006383 [Aphis glycines]|uniref:Uncharacterized protein n=1 Tax=Aphis glycines TaxID=307491 RepID=A0A6G0TQW0_APHGL|nr:hypothetical protein AGLY_006383 [Aphis glycines]